MTESQFQDSLSLLRACITVPEGMPFRSGAYDALRLILRAFLTLNKPSQALVVQELAFRGQWLLSCADRVANESIRSNDPEELRAGFIALALENGQNDSRDVIVALSLLSHSAIKLRVSADVLMQEAIAIAAPPTRRLIRSFLKRTPESRQIEQMGYREGVSKDGFSYEKLQ